MSDNTSASNSAVIAITIASTVLLIATRATPAAAAGTPLGIWLDESGRGAIEIAQCGNNLCGKVVWVKAAEDRNGCGKKILGDVRKVGSNTWDRGWIFSPEHGRRFDLALQPLGDNRLRVTGYAGIKLFGESRTWTRAPAELTRCDQPATTTAALTTEPAPTTSVAATSADTNAPAPTTTPPQSSPAPEPLNEDPSEQDATDNETDSPTVNENGGYDSDISPDDASHQKAPGLSGMQLKNFLKRTGNGNCQLNTPWIKISFACKNK